jgi:hypothetical protein
MRSLLGYLLLFLVTFSLSAATTVANSQTQHVTVITPQ